METRNDLNRIGLFSELGYISIGDPYTASSSSKYIFSLSFWSDVSIRPQGSAPIGTGACKHKHLSMKQLTICVKRAVTHSRNFEKHFSQFWRWICSFENERGLRPCLKHCYRDWYLGLLRFAPSRKFLSSFRTFQCQCIQRKATAPRGQQE